MGPLILTNSPGGSALAKPAAFFPALISAVLLFLASPGSFSFGPLAWIALLPLLYAILASTPGRAALLGLVCGLLYYISILYWIVIVLGRYGHLSWWITVPAMVLLALYMSLYVAVFAWAVARTAHALPLVVSAPLFWVALDFVRAHLFTGFPWMDLAYTQYRQPFLIQAADLFGHYGITFLIVLGNALALTAVLRCRSGDPVFSRPKGGLAAISFAAALLVAATAYGFFRLQQIDAQIGAADRLPVAVVQGDIPQDKKWLPSFQQQTLDTYVKLSEEALARQKDSLVIWPETALPFYPLENRLFTELINGFVKPAHATLLTGTPNRFRLTAKAPVQYFNSSFLISPAGAIVDKYDKQHLVPFGEYVPLRSILSFAPLVETIGDFTPGSSAHPLSVPNAKIGVLICFESIFPELARQQVVHGATMLTNITNDAWFGRSSAPWQHLAMAVLRAVETRRSLARAANTGISAQIDPRGRLLSISPLFQPFFLTARLPLLTEKTFYVRFGHHFAIICFALSCAAVVLSKKRTPAR